MQVAEQITLGSLLIVHLIIGSVVKINGLYDVIKSTVRIFPRRYRLVFPPYCTLRYSQSSTFKSCVKRCTYDDLDITLPRIVFLTLVHVLGTFLLFQVSKDCDPSH